MATPTLSIEGDQGSVHVKVKPDDGEFEAIWFCRHCKEGRHDLCAGKRCECARMDLIKARHR